MLNFNNIRNVMGLEFFVTSELKIAAPTISEALAQLKDRCGPDALIVSTEHHKDTCILHAEALTQTTSASQSCHPYMYADPMAAIRAVCDLCDQHQLSFQFCEKWLKELANDFVAPPIGIVRSLASIVHFDTHWLEELSPHQPLVFVGPPGSGKTLTVGKMAAFLLAQQKSVTVLTLDTLKAGGASQLKSYMDVMEQSLLVGIEHLQTVIENARSAHATNFVLIDTPGINILSQKDQDILYQLSQRINLPLTLCLGADAHPVEAENIAKSFHYFNTQTVIGTRFDATHHFGGLLSAAASAGLSIVGYSQGPTLADSLQPLSADVLLAFMEMDKKHVAR